MGSEMCIRDRSCGERRVFHDVMGMSEASLLLPPQSKEEALLFSSSSYSNSLVACNVAEMEGLATEFYNVASAGFSISGGLNILSICNCFILSTL